MFPVVAVADTDSVDMGIHGDQVLAATDIAQHVAHRVDLDPVEADRFHLLLDPLNHLFLVAALTGDGDHVPEEGADLRPVKLCFFDNLFKIKRHANLHSFCCDW